MSGIIANKAFTAKLSTSGTLNDSALNATNEEEVLIGKLSVSESLSGRISSDGSMSATLSNVVINAYEITIVEVENGVELIVTKGKVSQTIFIPDYSEDEATRVANEEARVAAENSRSEAEATRVANEDSRVASENSRSEAESQRSTNEDSRSEAENARSTAEATRVANEEARVAAETKRETDTATLIKEATEITEQLRSISFDLADDGYIYVTTPD